jgi:hypothetical protein
LCDLEGRTRREAAAPLSWPEGTVAGRLVRAREMLAKHLAPWVTIAALLADTAAARVPEILLATALPPGVAALTYEVIKAMVRGKLMKTAAVVILLACAGLGTALGAGRNKADVPEKAPVPPESAVANAGPEDKGDPRPKDRIEESAKKVKDLQKGRIDTLKELVDHAAFHFKSARASHDEVLEVQMMLLQAELDVTEKVSDRIALYKKAIKALKEYEEVADARVRAGQGTAAAALKIKVRRLEVEISLEQALAKEAQSNK